MYTRNESINSIASTLFTKTPEVQSKITGKCKKWFYLKPNLEPDNQ